MKFIFSLIFMLAVSFLSASAMGDVNLTLPFMGSLSLIGAVIPKMSGAIYSTLPVDVWDALNASIIRRNGDRKTAPSFLMSFFRVEETSSLNVLLRTKRNGKKVAVDTNIQTKGRMHKRQVGKLDIVQPPLYSYFTNMSLSDQYNGYSRLLFADRLTASDMAVIDDFSQVLSVDLEDMHDMIKRAKELQCAQLLSNGIVQFRNNDNIDFGRLVGSMDGSTVNWGTSGATYVADLTAGVDWIKTNASSSATVFHAIMGIDAFNNFISSEEIQKRQNIKHFTPDVLHAGRPTPEGGVYWGTVSLNNGTTLHIWSYGAEYDLANGTSAKYVAVNDVYVIPDRDSAELTFVQAEVKYLPGTLNTGRYRGMYTREWRDYRDQNHEYYLEDRFLAVSQEINEIYTLDTTPN